MDIIITRSTEAFCRSNVSSVLIIDLIVIIILAGLLIVQEFLKLNYDQRWMLQSDTKFNIGRIIYIAIIPFFYIFIYVSLYKALQVLAGASRL
jgi:hypothetical protein